MTPDEIALLREALLTLLGIVEAGLVFVAAMLVVYLAGCAWSALRSL